MGYWLILIPMLTVIYIAAYFKYTWTHISILVQNCLIDIELINSNAQFNNTLIFCTDILLSENYFAISTNLIFEKRNKFDWSGTIYGLILIVDQYRPVSIDDLHHGEHIWILFCLHTFQDISPSPLLEEYLRGRSISIHLHDLHHIHNYFHMHNHFGRLRHRFHSHHKCMHHNWVSRRLLK